MLKMTRLLVTCLVAAAAFTANFAQGAVIGPDTVNNNTNVNSAAQQQGQAQGQFQGQVLNSQNEAFSVSASKSEANNSNKVENSVVVQGDRINYEQAASSAADVFSTECSGGVSGQAEKFGFGLGEPDQVCLNLKMADAYFKLARFSEGEKRAGYEAKWEHHIAEAGYIVDSTNGISRVEKVVKKSVIPALAVTGALCLVSSGSFCPF